MKSLTRTEKLGYSFLVLLFSIGIYYANTNLEFFDTSYAQEDGFAEYGTAFMLLSIFLLLFSRLFKLWSVKSATWRFGMFIMGLVFLFGAGEEISWGQRIFNIESSEYFIEHNAQKETNLHNMVVDGTKINKLIFSQILTLVLVIYLIILPVIYRRFDGIKKLVDMFGVPISKWHHTIAFITATVLILAMPSTRKWELYELAFGVIFLLIFLNPLNKYIYKKR